MNLCNDDTTVAGTAKGSSPLQSAAFPPLSDETLELTDGRTLAYRTCGAKAAASKSVVFAFHGALGTGDFDIWCPVFERLGWFVVSPTLPGWGLSSPYESPGYTLQQYAENDMVQLTSHVFRDLLKSDIKEEQQFSCLGISFGCVHALACAVHLPDQVKGLYLLGPHGPFDDPSFNPLKGMALPSQMGLGTIGYHLPWLTKWTAKIVQKSVSTPEKARAFVKANLLDAMNHAEKNQFEQLAPQELKDNLSSGQGLHNSMCHSIEGYVGIPSVLRSWSHQDCHKIACPTHIFVAKGDVQTPVHGARYIHSKIQQQDAKLTEFKDGGHMTLVFSFEKCIESILLSV
ncbi:MAG: hypothetical protein SGILL_002497 [Bacillariaceae sp.]